MRSRMYACENGYQNLGLDFCSNFHSSVLKVFIPKAELQWATSIDNVVNLDSSRVGRFSPHSKFTNVIFSSIEAMKDSVESLLANPTPRQMKIILCLSCWICNFMENSLQGFHSTATHDLRGFWHAVWGQKVEMNNGLHLPWCMAGWQGYHEVLHCFYRAEECIGVKQMVWDPSCLTWESRMTTSSPIGTLPSEWTPYCLWVNCGCKNSDPNIDKQINQFSAVKFLQAIFRKVTHGIRGTWCRWGFGPGVEWYRRRWRLEALLKNRCCSPS